MSQPEQNTKQQHAANNARAQADAIARGHSCADCGSSLVNRRGEVIARHGIGRQSGHLVRFCPEHAEARGIGVVPPDLPFAPLPTFTPGEEVTSPNGDRWTVVRHTGPGRVHCERVGLDGFGREWCEEELLRPGWVFMGDLCDFAPRADPEPPQEAERPTHVVCLRGSDARRLTLGRVYKAERWDDDGDPYVSDDSDTDDGSLVFRGEWRPATPEEVALGHCSHVVVTSRYFTLDRVARRVDVIDRGIARGPHLVLHPGEWRPATLEEMGL